MISVTPVILPQQKAKNGAYNVKIRITYKRKSKYLATNIQAYPSDLNKKTMTLKPGNAMVQASGAVKQINDIISSMSYMEVSNMTVDDIVAKVKRKINLGEEFHLDFIQYMEERAAMKCDGTRRTYQTAIKALSRFVGGDSVDISKVNLKFLKELESFLLKERAVRNQIWTVKEGCQHYHDEKNPNTVRNYMNAIGSMYRAAMKEFNNPDTGELVIPVNPFDYYTPPKPKATAHRNIDKATIQAMINSRPHLMRAQAKAIDAFLISFALMGMNLADMWECGLPSDGVLIYNRKKTRERRMDRAEMRIRIEPCIKKLLSLHKGGDGSNLMFDFQKKHRAFVNLNMSVNTGLKAWCEKNGFPPFTFYAARHSWATLARSSEVGADKHTVNDCLIHVDKGMDVTDIYIAKDWRVFWDVNAKVLSLFDWSPVM